MKKSSIAALVAVCALSFASCQKDPDTDNLDNGYLVYTNYDSGTDFKTFDTFYVIDSILISTDNQEYGKSRLRQFLYSPELNQTVTANWHQRTFGMSRLR